MLQQFTSLVCLTGYEVLRTRFAWLIGTIIIIAYAIGQFAMTLAVTESADHATALYAASVRFGLVFVLGLLVISNVVRDDQDHILELLLSRPLKRGTWLAAKFFTYVIAAWLAAAAASLPLWFIKVPGDAVIAWSYSLGCELTLMVAAALTVAISLAHITAAFAATCAFYLLARTLHAMVLLTSDPLLNPESPVSRMVGFVVRGISIALPDFSQFTLPAWLVYAAPHSDVLEFITFETVLYAALLWVAGLIDLQRRNF